MSELTKEEKRAAYEEKQERRRDRYEELADKNYDKSVSHYQSSRDATRGIEPGQPILVGHHSESRHRNALKRNDSHMRKSIDTHKTAEYYEQKAKGVGKAGISSDDPDAVDKLKEKLEKAETYQADMKRINRSVRKNKAKANPAELVADETGLSLEAAAKIVEPDFCGRIGFPPYALQNNNAKIRSIKARIAELESVLDIESSRCDYEMASGDPFTVIYNTDINRVQIEFDGKPDADIRQTLKGQGFRWSRYEMAWQRQLNDNGIYAAKIVVESLTGQDK